MAWIYLFFAGFLEVVWAYYMKKSDGFTQLTPSVITISAMIVSFFCLAASFKSLPLGTAYAVFTGMGAVGAFAVGVIVLGESATPMRITAAVLILAGIVMMKLSNSH